VLSAAVAAAEQLPEVEDEDTEMEDAVGWSSDDEERPSDASVPRCISPGVYLNDTNTLAVEAPSPVAPFIVVIRDEKRTFSSTEEGLSGFCHHGIAAKCAKLDAANMRKIFQGHAHMSLPKG